MANYYEAARTNYFRVKDEEAFVKFISTIGGTEVVDDGNGRHCVLFTEEGVPSSRYVETADADGNITEDYEDFDFMSELAPFLADGSVAILTASGAEKLRYVGGYSIAINNKGESKAVNIDDIYALAKTLGDDVTQAHY
jgi:hypothetical protein